MERSNPHVMVKRLNIDIADCTKSQSSIGMEPVNKAFAFDFFIELLLNRYKGLGLDAFELHLRLIAHSILERGGVLANALDRMRQQNTLRGQGVVYSRADLGQLDFFVSKCDNVSVGRDTNLQFVVFTHEGAMGAHFKQLGMHVSREQVKIQISNFWPNG